MCKYPILKIPLKIKECFNESYVRRFYDPFSFNKVLMKCLSEISLPIFADITYTQGKSESDFYNFLINKSKQLFFYNNLIVKDEHYSGKPYLPDITFWEPTTNFILAIEIDEPYILETGIPTHCIGADDERDDYFLKNGWSVLRFSEYQVVKYPEECFRFIISVYFNICENLTDEIGYKELKSYPCWTLKEAYSMAYHRLRSIYLKEKIEDRMGADQFLLICKFMPK